MGDDGGQPSPQVVDAAGVGTAQSQPRFLDGIVGLIERAEHSVGHGPKMAAVLLEPLGGPVLKVHLAILLSGRHTKLTDQSAWM